MPLGALEPSIDATHAPRKRFKLEVLGLEARGAIPTASPIARGLTIELRGAASRRSIRLGTANKDLLDEQLMNNCQLVACWPSCAPPCMVAITQNLPADRSIYGWVTVTGSTMSVELTMLEAATGSHVEWSLANVPLTGNVTAIAEQAITELLRQAP